MQRLVTYSFHSFYSEPRHRQVYIMPATLKDTHEEEFKKKKTGRRCIYPPTHLPVQKGSESPIMLTFKKVRRPQVQQEDSGGTTGQLNNKHP